MNLNEWRDEVWRVMEGKGFHEGRGIGRDDTLVRLCLIHTEVSEAAQEVKRRWRDAGPSDDVKDAFSAEIADIVIRVMDLCGCTGIDLEQSVSEKMRQNRVRPRKYGTPEEGK